MDIRLRAEYQPDPEPMHTGPRGYVVVRMALEEGWGDVLWLPSYDHLGAQPGVEEELIYSAVSQFLSNLQELSSRSTRLMDVADCE